MADPTQMPAAAPDPTAAPAPAAPASQDDAEGSGGFVVCIAAQDDGTFQVYEQDGDEAQDDASASPDASQGSDTDDGTQTADNVDDALAIAKQMIEQESSEGEGDDSGEDGNAPLDQDSAKKVWAQMAAKKDKSRMAGE